MLYHQKYVVFSILTISVTLLCGTCAPYGTLKGNQQHPMVASTVPVAPTTPAIQAPPAPIEDNSAGAWLERGFVFFHQGQYRASADAFSEAISTGHLNDAGRALAYWHIFESERDLNNQDQCAEAVASFLIVADEVLSVRQHVRFAVDTEGDFVEHFRLESKIATARGFLEAAWATRVNEFGRTTQNPVVVQNYSEMEYFVKFAPTCQGMLDRRVIRKKVKETGEFRLYKITVTCDANNIYDRFFIVIPSQVD